MKQRLITAGVLLCILVPVLILSGTVLFPIAAAVFCCAAMLETHACLGIRKNPFVFVPAMVLACILPLCTMFIGGIGENLTVQHAGVEKSVLYLLLVSACMVLYLFILFGVAVFGRRSVSFAQVAEAFATTFYVILAFVTIPIIRFGVNGEWYYLLCFLGAWITDSFACIVGYFIGKHKLIPEISPKKTVEGCVGGVLFCMLSFAVLAFIFDIATAATPNYLGFIILGFFVSIVAQLGDLIASLLKREHGIKDFGNLFPGHGGVMDRFDSVIATAPLLLIACTADGLLGLHFLL